MKYFILLFIFTTTIFALPINDSLLKVHAILIPKISLMDFKVKQKIENNSIVIALMYNKVNYKNALSLKNKIDTKYRDGIQNYTIKTKLVLYSKISNENANIYYLLPTTTKNIKKVIMKANSNQALTFSYLNNDLKHGVMLSLIVGSKVKPLINLEAIRLHNISLRPVLLDISEIYLNKARNSFQKIYNRGLLKKNIYIAFLSEITSANKIES